jgi:hypothetical protein
MGRRMEGLGFSSVPAMSCPRLPARKPCQGERLIPEAPSGAGSQHRRGKPSFCIRPALPDGESGSNLLSGAGCKPASGDRRKWSRRSIRVTEWRVVACATGGF